MSFIQELVKEITSKHERTDEYVIILPSRRAKRYVLNAVANAISQPVFPPMILTFGEFLETNVPFDTIDKTLQLFYLYNVAQKTDGFKDVSFDEFTPWAEILISDFEELQHQLVSVNQAFDNVFKIKQLEGWNLESDYSIQQKRELEFWERIPVLYEAFLKELSHQKKMTAAQKSVNFSNEVLSLVDLNKHYYFLGFNALTKAETSIISKLIKSKCASVFFEISKDHFDNNHHEAGVFIRKNLLALQIDNPQFISAKPHSESPIIEIVECVQSSSQIKVVSTELDGLSDEELSKTAVILADENLLIPLLKSIPKSVKKANFTVGLALNQTPVKTFVDRAFSIQENKKRLKNSKLYHKDLWAILRNPLVRCMMSDEEQSSLGLWESDSIRNNVIFYEIKDIPVSSPITQILYSLTEDWRNDYRLGVHNITDCANKMLEFLTDNHGFERQILETLVTGLQDYLNYLPKSLPIMSLATFKRIFQNHWGQLSIGYHGSPTKGLQIMGLLESRMLSFERVYILGMNEGNLPKTNPIDSHLPMDLRRALELPTPREKQGLFAHHFYRLLYESKHVFLTYKSTEEGIGAAEKSRYITQLFMENSPDKIRLRHFFSGQLGNTQNKAFSIQKNADVQALLDHYFASNVSASAFLTYLDCPLNFYYKYILGLGEDDEIEEDMDMGSVGTLVHKVLEELYSPFALNDVKGIKKNKPPQPLTEDKISLLMTKAPAILKAHFIDFLNGDEERVARGKNWLTLKMATKLVLSALEEDLNTVLENKKPIEIIQLETPLKADMHILVDGKERILHWIGYIDRIDRIGDGYRIIDYKTGILKADGVKLMIKEDIFKTFSESKHALQLLVYNFLFEKNFSFFPDQTMIYSLPNRKSVKKIFVTDTMSNTEQMELLQKFASSILTDLFNNSTLIEHNEKAIYCKFC